MSPGSDEQRDCGSRVRWRHENPLPVDPLPHHRPGDPGSFGSVVAHGCWLSPSHDVLIADGGKRTARTKGLLALFKPGPPSHSRSETQGLQGPRRPGPVRRSVSGYQPRGLIIVRYPHVTIRRETTSGTHHQDGPSVWQFAPVDRGRHLRHSRTGRRNTRRDQVIQGH